MNNEHPAELAIAAKIGDLSARVIKAIADGECHTHTSDYGFSVGKGAEVDVQHEGYTVSMRVTIIANINRPEESLES
jgi:hypothetical protein